MNKFLGISLLIAANLILVASLQNKTIFENADIYNQIMPALPFPGLNVPGTKWCGIGNSASGVNDLGKFNETDMCCQSHEQCKDIIEPLGNLYTLHNPSILPKYECQCEQQLMNCLRLVNDLPSVAFGQAYFAVMGQCFANDYPVIECVEYQVGKLGKRCISYSFDETKSKAWQFFDLPFFTVHEE